jgi:hypothetical protein
VRAGGPKVLHVVAAVREVSHRTEKDNTHAAAEEEERGTREVPARTRIPVGRKLRRAALPCKVSTRNQEARLERLQAPQKPGMVLQIRWKID